LAAAAGDGTTAAVGSEAGALRLAVAAALQGTSLTGGATFDLVSNTKTTAALLQGLDAQGVDTYMDQLVLDFVAGRVTPGATGGVATEAAAGGGADAAAADAARQQVLQQLAAAAKFPAAGAAARARALAVLAAAALLAPRGAAAPKEEAVKKLAKKLASPDLVTLVTVVPQLSDATRQVAAARLLGLVQALQARLAAGITAAARQQQQQQGSAGDGSTKQGKAAKKQKMANGAAATAGGDPQQQQEQVAALREEQERLLEGVLSFIEAATAADGKQPFTLARSLDEAAAEGLEQLQQLTAVIQDHHQQQQQEGGGHTSSGSSSGKVRSMLHLLQVLQLQLVTGATPAGVITGVVGDLGLVLTKGLQLGDGGGDASSDMGDDSSDDEGEAKPYWSDVLLDVLLALLSSSGEGSGSGGSGAADGGSGGGGSSSNVQLPTTLLREACEAVFRACAEDVTAAGGSGCTLQGGRGGRMGGVGELRAVWGRMAGFKSTTVQDGGKCHRAGVTGAVVI
jgi:hypothetical protein